MRTQVVIIGAGPAGLLLGQLLQRRGIDNIILERQTADHVIGRVRANAAHIVPPTGAKGLNLAASDVRYLSRALIEHYEDKSDAGLDHYSARALARVWKAERFSWWMTMTLHRISDNPFDHQLQLAELDYLFQSKAAATGSPRIMWACRINEAEADTRNNVRHRHCSHGYRRQ